MLGSLPSLLQKAMDGDPAAGLEAARRPEAGSETLERLAHHPFPETRMAVAAHPNVAPETLLRLAYDPDFRVAAAVARRGGLSGEILHGLFLRAQAGFLMTRGRERAQVYELLLALSDNESASLAAIQGLLREIPTSHLPRLLARKAARPELLRWLSAHPKATVRIELSTNPALPAEIVESLSRDLNDKVAAAASKCIEARFQDIARAREEFYPEEKKRQGAAAAAAWERDSALFAGGEAAGRARTDFFTEPVTDRMRVLDLGCGTGLLTRAIAGKNPRGATVGMDIAPKMLALAEACAREMPNLAWREADLSKGIPEEDASADFVIAHGLLHAVPEPIELLREVLRVLKEGGIFRAVVTSLDSITDGGTRFAEVAREHGFFFAPFEEVSVLLATSGLVFQALPTASRPIPALTDPEVLARVACPVWHAVLKDAAAAGVRPEDLSFGLLRVEGRKAAF
ncbi:MAG: methyltransferase domain-containing protein [Planctomycetota bacterium]